MTRRRLSNKQIYWAAGLWHKRMNTKEIAGRLQIDESRVYNSLDFIKDRLRYELRASKSRCLVK
jgi:DNA-directed RNA polymerase specialized sigma subunit